MYFMYMEINPIRLYKAAEVAEALHIADAAVRELIASGQLRAKRIRPNSHPRVPGQAILDFVESQTKPAEIA